MRTRFVPLSARLSWLAPSGLNLDALGGNNTVVRATGKIGSAASFTAANSESLSHVDNASLSTGDIDFTLDAWVYLSSKSADRVIVA